LTPYPQFTSISATSSNGVSQYNALQITVGKRFTRGFSIQGAYSYSKLREAITLLNAGDVIPPWVVSSSSDYPQRLSISGIYELPFGAGRRFLNARHSVPGAIMGGWQVQGVYQYQVYTALGFGNAIFTGNIGDIPLPRDERTRQEWFNVNAGFNRISSQQLLDNLRTLPLAFSNVRAAPVNNFDLSAIKIVGISERFKLELRGEFLNALNHCQFAAPNTTPSSTAFGTVTAQANQARQAQIIAKLRF
jgi:hypothetical protein